MTYEHLTKVHKDRKDATLKKVDAAISALIKNNRFINFNSVHQESGLSKTTLYNNKEIRDRINTLRAQQEGISSPERTRRTMSDKSKDAIIESLRRKIKKLELENKQLKEQIKINLSDIYKNI